MSNLFSILYMLLGFAAFIVSFKIETLFLSEITGEFWISTLTIGIFEFAKVGTIVVQRYLYLVNKFMSGIKKVSPFVRYLTLTFQILLITVSFLSSLALIANYLDKPNFNKAKQEDLDLINKKYELFYNDLKSYYDTQIALADGDVKAEMQNVVNGTFMGPKYRELVKRRKDLEKQFNEERTKLQERKSLEIAELEKKSYKNDERVQNKMIAAFLATLSSGLGINVSYVTFTLVFSALISFLLEATIYVVFNYTTINYFETLAKDIKFDENTQVAAGPSFLTRLFLIPNKFKNKISEAKKQAESIDLPKNSQSQPKTNTPIVEKPKEKVSIFDKTFKKKNNGEDLTNKNNPDKINLSANNIVQIDPVTGKITFKN
ncbi:MAG TPA: hypothetical protein PLU62_09640 [Ignavibacteriales bacterium]|nr:hypothetical protein [Ignavibacteriales bacterium]HPP34189.1 hypothetical protein [Ignavibacteriales bacterium]